MRVLHVIPGLDNASGPTHAAINLTERLARLGVEVSLFHLVYEGREPLRPDPALVRTRGFPCAFPRRWGYSPGLRDALREQAGDFDVVHVHSVWMYPTTAAARACRRAGTPYVVRPAGSFEPWCLAQRAALKTLYYRARERRNLAGAAALHAMSEQERLHLERLGLSTPVFVVPNAISLEGIPDRSDTAGFRRRYGLGQKTPLVLFLSRIHPKKGLDVVAAAFARVLRQVPEARLMIAGPVAGGYQREFESCLNRAGVREQTVLPGELRGEDRWTAYRAADVFTLPSYSENFGIVVAEALACGTPVVVSRNTPWKDVEEQDAGRWLELKPQAFARAVVELLRNPRLAAQMGRNGRALVEANYTWRGVAARVLSLYEELCRVTRRAERSRCSTG